VLPQAPSLYRMVLTEQPYIFYTVPCDLTLEDLTPETPPARKTQLSDVTFDDRDQPICPHCQTTMELKSVYVLFDIYRCSTCGTEIEL
jgi:hypothetical protein